MQYLPPMEERAALPDADQRLFKRGDDYLFTLTYGSDVHWVKNVLRAHGMIHAMRTTIDRAGRLVIPRALRDHIGLVGGGEVELELDGAAIRIEPVAGVDLREDGGLLFIPAAGTPITKTLVRELIDADRHGR